MEVDATGRWGEGECVIPGEICSSAIGLMSSRGDMKGEQKSAEGIVAIAYSGEGPNVEGRESAGGRSRNIGYGAPSAPVISVNMKGKASVVIGTTSGQIYSAPVFSPTTNKAIMYWREVIP